MQFVAIKISSSSSFKTLSFASFDLIIIIIILVYNQMNKREEKRSDWYTNIIHKAFQFMLKKSSCNYFCTGSEDTLRAWTVSNLCQHKYKCSIPSNLTKKQLAAAMFAWFQIIYCEHEQCPLQGLSGQDTGGKHVGSSALPSDWADNCICPIENTVGIHLFLSKDTQRYNSWTILSFLEPTVSPSLTKYW